MLRPPALRAAALAVTGAAAFVPSIPTADGPPPGYSGGFGEPSCVACHTGNDENAFDGSVSIEGLPAVYAPGEAYALTVFLQAEGTEVAGFQLTARYGDGDRRGANAGRLEHLDDLVAIRDSAGVSYAHQTPKGSTVATGDRAVWTVSWVAPETGTATINVAANSGNADNSPLSDLVYTTEVSIAPAR